MADSVNDTRMKIWNAVQTTDPAHTKKVEFGRKFTSIDAMWQIKRMTETFGPIGQGWGYTASHSFETLSPTMIIAVCDVTIWWKDGSDQENLYGPVRGTTEIWSPDKSGKQRLDDDAPKKSMTDALTKGLSHLGLSADVFLGLFDDNKYVATVTRQFAAQAAAAAPLPVAVETIKRLIAEAGTEEALDVVAANARSGVAGIDKAHLDLIALWFKEKRIALKERSKASQAIAAE